MKTNLLKVAGKMSTAKARCQCMATCIKSPLKGEAFCKEHLTFCPRRAPTNGYEPLYEPNEWNHPLLVKVYNCFAYAFNIRDIKQEEKCKASIKCNLPFHQPGTISGYPGISEKKEKTCPNIIARMMGDNPHLVPSAFELKCPPHMSKIALMIDPKQDYHYLRQNPSDDDIQYTDHMRTRRNATHKKRHTQRQRQTDIGYFSGKSGELPVTDRDAQGHKIFDVELANFNYKDVYENLMYTEFCGYFCVSRKKVYAAIGGYRRTRSAKHVKRH